MSGLAHPATQLAADTAFMKGALGIGDKLPDEIKQMLVAGIPLGRLTEPDDLMEQAMDVARTIIRKQRRVLAAAKHALNAIDPFDLTNNYRLEQGYTFELNLLGVSDEHRDEFVATGKPRENATQKEG